MARVKATTTDILAKLAKGECANFVNCRCAGRDPCVMMTGGNCDYFVKYVKPLLRMPEIAGKYHREAKISLALNPGSKVVRKRPIEGNTAAAKRRA